MRLKLPKRGDSVGRIRVQEAVLTSSIPMESMSSRSRIHRDSGQSIWLWVLSVSAEQGFTPWEVKMQGESSKHSEWVANMFLLMCVVINIAHIDIFLLREKYPKCMHKDVDCGCIYDGRILEAN